MAACLISITGTSGLLRLDYKISGDSYTIETSIGDFYIEDTATDVTYTTLTGDVIASSLCLTITELSATCYNLQWNDLSALNYKFSQLQIGSNTYSLSNIPFPNYGNDTLLVNTINNLNVAEVKCVGYKLYDATSVSNSNNSSGYCFFYKGTYILKVLGNEIPTIKLSDSSGLNFIYIKGVEYICDNMVTDGYKIVNPCYTTSLSPL